MKRFIYLITAMLVAMLPAYGSPVVVDFEDLYSGVQTSEILQDEYEGFSWSGNANWITSQAAPLPGSGVEYGTVGNVSIITSAEDLVVQPISMERGTSFDFVGAAITAAWNINQDFTVEGWRSGTKVYSRYRTTSYDGPHWFPFNFIDVDTLWFIPGTGGTDAVSAGDGHHLVIDNITTTPEPCSLLLLALGSLMLRKPKA